MTAGFDFGLEQASNGSSDYNTWYSPVVIAKYFFDDKWSVNGRAELYADPEEVIIVTGTENGFRTSGYSLGLDYRIVENAVWRIEGRILTSEDDIFLRENEAVKTNTCLTTSLAVSF